MSINNITHAISFAIVFGFFAYLTSALWSAIFIVSLPMDADAVSDSIEIETIDETHGGVRYEWLPTEFKNSLEELKYHHNVRMLNRNRYWVYGQLIIGGFIGLIVFYIVPKMRGTLETEYEKSGIACASIFFSALVVLLGQSFFSWILPAPAKWFPQRIVDIAESREREALTRLEALAKELESERKTDP